ncbi:MAG: twin-arginine translocase subunit TatC [Proteobacteria bacterium]|nr:MAG: twin-arginine translocase subunit TatC [Pseudomonadota bacterium]
MTEPSDNKENLAEGTLLSHLLELRTRLMKAFIAVGVAFVPCAIYANDLFDLLSKPLIAKLPKGGSLLATNVMSPFTTPFKLSFMVALFIAMPVVLGQIWGFVAPGLYRHEKRFAAPLMISSIVLFYAGMAFAYFVVFPIMFEFFTATTPTGVSFAPAIDQYLDFVLTLFLAFGIAFEVPIAVVLLAITGLVSVEKLGSSRGYVIIGIFIVAAILTPPDALSQTAMAIPMWLLYEAGVFFARLMVRDQKNKARALDET